MKRSLAIPALALSILAAACSKDPPPPPATTVPTATASATLPAMRPLPSAATLAGTSALTGPKWVATVPVKPAAAKPGDRVWALAPAIGETKTFGVFEVDSVQGATATVLGLTRSSTGTAKDPAARHLFTPGALMSPAEGATKMKAGDIVIAPVAGYHPTAAHVTKIDGSTVQFKFARGEKVEDESYDYVAPLGSGVAPFAYVAIKSSDGYQEALVAAVIDDVVFAVDESGELRKAPKAEVKPLDVQWKDRKKGDKVVAFGAHGSVETTIETVSVNKWIYQVKIGDTLVRLPFYAVVDKI